MPLLLLACSLALIPWIVYLGLSLPTRSTIQHYRLFWVGLDIAITLALVCTAWLALRSRPEAESAAVATATLLGTDVWLDVTSAGPGWPLLYAVARAVVIELPGAILLVWAFQPTRREVVRRHALELARSVHRVLCTLASTVCRVGLRRQVRHGRHQFIAVEAAAQDHASTISGSDPE
ncbi:MAG TPA: hypothetical protein VKX16_03785 [Chloroflexota bacterium]|nr:hypothetical protein [Chloroflexota bacterium]